MSGIPAGAGQLLGKRLGKFDILALLALGGTAEIYLARIGGAAGFEKYVVVKCLHDHLADDAEFVRMFLDEARLAAHLDHSNIVQTMELGQHEGRYYMVMEFLAGLSLAMIVRRVAERLPSTRIPVPLVLNILAQSCAGLHYAHEKAMNGRALNIVHRDISPQNLVISFEGVVKVVDFGIAKAEMRETHTRSGTIKGKFAYMSPEQCVANNVDRRTDVFALGVIGHELLVGQRLFKRSSAYETYQSVIECDVKPPSTIEHDIDPALDAVIMRALTKDKADRYPSAEAFGDALLGYLHHRGIGSGPGDVSRFFDSYFGQELEEHSTRMRELISGREISVDTGVTWGGGEVEEEAGLSDMDPTGRGPRAPGVDEQLRGAAGPLSLLLDDLGSGSRINDDDEMPAEHTRIESNPLDRISELDRVVSSKPAKRSGSKSSKQPRPASASPPPSAGPASSPAGSPKPPGMVLPGMPAPGRFPDLENIPTVIAAGDPPPDLGDLAATAASAPVAAPAFSHPPTNIPSPVGAVPSALLAFSNAPTGLAPPAATGFANAPTALAPSSHADNATQVAPMPVPPNGPPAPGNGGRSQPWHPRPQISSSSPPVHSAPMPPPGYPVMNAQLSAQIATGATVFPSDARANPGHPAAPAAPAMLDPGDSESFPSSRPSEPAVNPGMPGMPGTHDAAMISDQQHAANIVSPVGQQYPDHVDWGAVAASRARAVPPWLLAVLFIGTLAVALTLTIVIAKLIR